MNRTVQTAQLPAVERAEMFLDELCKRVVADRHAVWSANNPARALGRVRAFESEVINLRLAVEELIDLRSTT